VDSCDRRSESEDMDRASVGEVTMVGVLLVFWRDTILVSWRYWACTQLGLELM
jgi:hypothetical protein